MLGVDDRHSEIYNKQAVKLLADKEKIEFILQKMRIIAGRVYMFIKSVFLKRTVLNSERVYVNRL
jgi:hypothetical protein